MSNLTSLRYEDFDFGPDADSGVRLAPATIPAPPPDDCSEEEVDMRGRTPTALDLMSVGALSIDLSLSAGFAIDLLSVGEEE